MSLIVNILEKNNPDCKQELLWLDIKKNFNLLKTQYNINYNLDSQSELLNELQKNKLFEQINKIIIENLIKYSEYSIESNDMYHKSLCYKHMKTLQKIISVSDNIFLNNYKLLKLIS